MKKKIYITHKKGDANGEGFASCSALQSVDLRALQTISGGLAASSMFQSCSALQSVDLRALQTISGNYAAQNMFSSFSALTTLHIEDRDDARRLLEVSTTIPDDTEF